MIILVFEPFPIFIHFYIQIIKYYLKMSTKVQNLR